MYCIYGYVFNAFMLTFDSNDGLQRNDTLYDDTVEPCRWYLRNHRAGSYKLETNMLTQKLHSAENYLTTITRLRS